MAEDNKVISAKSAVLIGIGVGFAFIFLPMLFGALLDIYSVSGDWRSGDETSSITVNATSVRITLDGEIVVSGMVENTGESSFQSLSLSGFIYEGDELIEECTGDIPRGPLRSNSSSHFLLYCSKKWKDLEAAAINVEVDVIGGFVADGT